MGTSWEGTEATQQSGPGHGVETHAGARFSVATPNR